MIKSISYPQSKLKQFSKNDENFFYKSKSFINLDTNNKYPYSGNVVSSNYIISYFPNIKSHNQVAFKGNLLETNKKYSSLTPTKTVQNKNIQRINNVTSEQKKLSHLIIHTASGICGALSGAMGEGAAVGADTPFLMGAQYAMFVALQKTFGISSIDHSMYILRQYMQGRIIGTQGAKMLISWLGIGGEAVDVATTGGVGSSTISGAIRAVNASLSTALTEKMGWGYVSEYKRDNMHFAKQALQTVIYTLGTIAFGYGSESAFDTTNPENIKDAINAIPKETMSDLGNIIRYMTSLHLDRFTTMFVLDLLSRTLLTKNKPTKEQIISSFKSAMLNTVIYDLLDYSYGMTITEETKHTVEKIAEEFKNNNSVFKEFDIHQRKIFTELNLDDLSVEEFRKKFKDKTFVYNLAILSREATRDIVDKWRKRNFANLQSENANIKEQIMNEQNKANTINSQLTTEQKLELDKALKETILKTQNDLINKTRSNHAMGRIAGYDGVKSLLDIIYITPVKNKEEKIVPNLIMFYGPSGLGKTAMGVAMAEDAGTKFVSKTLGMGNKRKTLDWIKKRLEEGAQNYDNTKRFSIIQLNEFDDFLNNEPELLEEFLQLIDNSAKKYHSTIFLTTNNPLLINEKILKKVDVTIPIGVASKNDIYKIVDYYVNNKEIEGYNLDEIVEEFEKVKPEYIYSNAQIEHIITRMLPKTQCTQDDLKKAIHSEKPRITKEINDEFENQFKYFTNQLLNDYQKSIKKTE